MNDHDEDHSYISNDLDSLANTNAMLDELEKERDNKIDDCIPPEIHKRMAEIADEYDEKMMGAQIAVSKLRELIKQDVLEHGETVKGEHLQAVWNKGRTSWDTKALKGYAVVHPEINELRKTGDPSVTIRKV